MFLSLFKAGQFEPTGKPSSARVMITLYRSPHVASCVFRALDELSKTIVLRMLCGNITLHEGYMNFMVLEGKDSKELKASLKELEELAVMRKQGDQFNLNDKFRTSLERFITDPQNLVSYPVPAELR